LNPHTQQAQQDRKRIATCNTIVRQPPRPQQPLPAGKLIGTAAPASPASASAEPLSQDLAELDNRAHLRRHEILLIMHADSAGRGPER
jgi:hypothetical protein